MPQEAVKTELARSLSRTLGMPLLGKDMIKEPLMDAHPVPDRERSMEVGRATFRLLFALSQAFLDADVGMIMEALPPAVGMGVLRVDTSAGYRPSVADVADWVRQQEQIAVM